MIELRPDVVSPDPDMVRLYGGSWIDVVGVQHRRKAARSFALAALEAADKRRAFGAVARPEPENPRDRNAVAVDGYVDRDRRRFAHLGYLPREVAADLAGRSIGVALANLHMSDSDLIDIEVVVYGHRDVEEVLAGFDSAARRQWLQTVCMPGLKILAHIAAADGATDSTERALMRRYAERVRNRASTTIDDRTIAQAVEDAVSLCPTETVVRSAYRTLADDGDLVAELLFAATDLARHDGIEENEARALRQLLAYEAKAREG